MNIDEEILNENFGGQYRAGFFRVEKTKFKESWIFD